MNIKHETIAEILLSDYQSRLTDHSTAYAPANIALIKYWGKRNTLLNLPVNDSLSISLGDKGTKTTIQLSDAGKDVITLNGCPVEENSSIYRRITAHIELFRYCFGQEHFHIDTVNTISTAAGLASSASGFAALTKALARIYGLNLPESSLSILSRLGSGSACRSLTDGFVRWNKGSLDNGLDSYGVALEQDWPELGIAILTISTQKKSVSSRQGMLNTVNTSALYKQWATMAKKDMESLIQAINTKNFNLLGKTAEQNSMAMHATMLSSWPPLLYWTPETVRQVNRIWHLRQDGLALYFTMDAGPNIKILFEKHNIGAINEFFPETEVIFPFQGR